MNDLMYWTVKVRMNFGMRVNTLLYIGKWILVLGWVSWNPLEGWLHSYIRMDENSCRRMNEFRLKDERIPVEGWLNSYRRMIEFLQKDGWIPVEGWMNFHIRMDEFMQKDG